jgi:5-methylcytosine-specific restriction endonuclease McrA
MIQKLKPKKLDLERIEIRRNPGLRKKVWERDQGVCIDCGRFSAKWEHDHAIPLHNGGADTLENSVTRCKSCHRRKSNNELTAKAKSDRIRQREATSKARRFGFLQSALPSGAGNDTR